MNDDTAMKNNIIFIALVCASLGVGWWARGCTVDREVKERIENAPQVTVNYQTEKPVVLPELPAKTKPAKPGIKIVTDTAAVQNAIDSVSVIYADSLAMMRELLKNRQYEYEDTVKGFYMSLQAMTPVPPVITNLRIKSVKCDSIVVTKYVPVPPDVPWYDHWYVGALGTLGITAAILSASK